MIVIKVELWPGGDEARAREIARGRIANDGTGTLSRGNYKTGFTGAEPGYVRSGTVTKFPRAKRNVWELLRRALNDAAERRPF